MNVFALFRSRFGSAPAHPFVQHAGQVSMTYGQIDDASGRLASALHGLGLAKGDRVVVRMEKSAWLIAMYFACLRAGLVFVPVNPHGPAAEVARIVDDAQPGLVVQDEAEVLLPGSVRSQTLTSQGGGSLGGAAAGLAPLDPVPVDAQALGLIVYTSGSTGAPKGVCWSHGLMCSNAQQQFGQWGFRRDDVFLHALPMFHSHGLSVALNSVLMSGCTLRMLSRFDTEEVIAQLAGCTIMSGVPTMYIRLLESAQLTARACKGMRLFMSSSAGLPAAISTQFERRTGHRILEYYGLTETGTLASNPLEGERVSGSVGRALPGVELKTVSTEGAAQRPGEIGELRVRKPQWFSGYWRRAEETARAFAPDGFYCTGDLATIDPRGYVHLVGRSRDVIVAGGFKIYPREIETALDRQAGVRQSVVLGVPHPSLGEVPVALVVLDPQGTGAQDTLLDRLRAELPAYKLPRRIIVSPELPRGASGKIDVQSLRAQLADLFAANAA